MPAVFEMVVIIVAIVFAASVVNNYLKLRTKGADSGELEKRLDARLKTIEKLEQRVQVLEKIVTDRNFDLKRQLDDLDRESRSA